MGGIGVPAEQSWESWWEAEQEHLRHSGKFVTVVEILLALRFFIYQYGLVYHLTITEKTNNVLAIPIGRQKFSAMSRWMFRFIEWVLFVTFIAILVILITVAHMTIQDIFVCILAFIPTSWGMLLIAQACQPVVHRAGFGFWGLVRSEDTSSLLFTPVAFLAWFPIVSEFQTRMLFNPDFSRGLQISRILGGDRKDRIKKE